MLSCIPFFCGNKASQSRSRPQASAEQWRLSDACAFHPADYLENASSVVSRAQRPTGLGCALADLPGPDLRQQNEKLERLLSARSRPSPSGIRPRYDHQAYVQADNALAWADPLRCGIGQNSINTPNALPMIPHYEAGPVPSEGLEQARVNPVYAPMFEHHSKLVGAVTQDMDGRAPESEKAWWAMQQNMFASAAAHLRQERRLGKPDVLRHDRNAARGRCVAPFLPGCERLETRVKNLRSYTRRCDDLGKEMVKLKQWRSHTSYALKSGGTHDGPFHAALEREFAIDACAIDGPPVIIATHLLPDATSWLIEMCLRNKHSIVIPKRSTRYNTEVIAEFRRCGVEHQLRSDLTRDDLRDPDFVKRLVGHAVADDTNAKAVIIDHGGYFAPALHAWSTSDAKDMPRVKAIIEWTGNGHARYEEVYKACSPIFPVISVARSGIKRAENREVARAVVQQTQACMFQQRLGSLHAKRNIAIIGYGAIGSHLADALQSVSGAQPCVFDTRADRRNEARAAGCKVARTLEELLSQAEVVFCATGAKSIATNAQADLLNDGTILISVTSRDDELGFYPEQFDFLDAEINDEPTLEAFPILTRKGIIFALAGGNAINLVAGGTPGHATQVVRGAVAAQLMRLEDPASVPKSGVSVQDIDPMLCNRVVEIWEETSAA